MFSSLLKEVTGFLDRRFFINVLLPCLIFWGLLIAIWFAGYGNLAAAARRWAARDTSIQLIQAGGFLAWVTLFASVMDSNSTAILKFFEGYWRIPIVGEYIKDIGRSWHRKKLESLALRIDEPEAYEEINLKYPLPEQAEVMPTLLGNILKNAELYPRDRYGLDAVLFWPRLYPLFPPQFAADIAQLRGNVDKMLLVTILAAVFSLLSGGYLLVIRAPWLLFVLCFGGGVITMFTAYRGAMGSVMPYAEQIKTAFDLYRNDLLQRMRVPLPTTLDEEKKRWQELGYLVYRLAPSDPSAWVYVDPKKAEKDKPEK
jgi:hypothetical protein